MSCQVCFGFFAASTSDTQALTTVFRTVANVLSLALFETSLLSGLFLSVESCRCCERVNLGSGGDLPEHCMTSGPMRATPPMLFHLPTSNVRLEISLTLPNALLCPTRFCCFLYVESDNSCVARNIVSEDNLKCYSLLLVDQYKHSRRHRKFTLQCQLHLNLGLFSLRSQFLKCVPSARCLVTPNTLNLIIFEGTK